MRGVIIISIKLVFFSEMSINLKGGLGSSSIISDFVLLIMNMVKRTNKKEKESMKNIRKFKIITLNTQTIENFYCNASL